jgi:hypothetical protein
MMVSGFLCSAGTYWTLITKGYHIGHAVNYGEKSQIGPKDGGKIVEMIGG